MEITTPANRSRSARVLETAGWLRRSRWAAPMSVLLDREDGRWPTTIVPFQVGVLQFPIPTAARCYKAGKALRRAIESYPEDIRVAVVATGGLSHQVHGERAGFNNPGWDREFLNRITDDPASLTEMTHAEFATLGGLRRRTSPTRRRIFSGTRIGRA
jgi:hypothetical protein